MPVALLCKLTWNLDMGHTSKQAFSKIHFFPFAFLQTLALYLHPGIMTFSPST